MILHIIILSYNCLDILKRCINQIYANTNNNFKIFVLDNGSKDNSSDYLNFLEHEQSNLYVNFQEKNLGVIKGRNICYQFSREIDNDFSHVIFLDSDQFVLPKWKESYIKLFDKGYDVIGQIAWKMRAKDYYPYKMIKNKNEEFNYVSCGGMMIKDCVIKEVGLFDEEYKKYYFEDPSFCFKASKAGYKIGWNYNPVIEHQKHNLALKGERKKYFIENWKKFRCKWKGHKMPIFKMRGI